MWSTPAYHVSKYILFYSLHDRWREIGSWLLMDRKYEAGQRKYLDAFVFNPLTYI